MPELRETSATQAALDRAVSRTYGRLGLYLMLAYVVAFLDRANVGYAKQALQVSVGISESVFCPRRRPLLHHLLALRIPQQPHPA